MPAWDFVRDLLTEAARRTGSRAEAERAAELFAAYRPAWSRMAMAVVPRGLLARAAFTVSPGTSEPVRGCVAFAKR
ncbi:hypothetical protein [Streptomyces acidicola]|uniref:Uncharacterized protein n=1 Tax=Streptomyces acidicola TaxID=2596892 RepID=A0A5N8X726_9ACTN|nr:hypothetical protein [Streptomyces acidicola]MPY54828.1 hypothetical protein [Streptomyces acidicola]